MHLDNILNFTLFLQPKVNNVTQVRIEKKKKNTNKMC